jgi:hypothetical protein
MGRPPLPLGTYGKVLFRQLPSGQVLARVKFRDFDGRVRLVSKTGRTRAGAERALKTELTNRQAPGGAGPGPRRERSGPPQGRRHDDVSLAEWRHALLDDCGKCR